MLIFDVGFYRGEDSQYYLARGHSVVAFEANPILYEAGRKKFEEFISDGRLILENCGVGKDSGTSIDFFCTLTAMNGAHFTKRQPWGGDLVNQQSYKSRRSLQERLSRVTAFLTTSRPISRDMTSLSPKNSNI